MSDSEDRRQELAERKPLLVETSPSSERGIVGSDARGEHHAESDRDGHVLVAFDEPVPLFELVRLENELTDRLGVDVDLVTRESLKPRVGERVASEIQSV